MQTTLQNRTALVTGSTAGIGFSIARELATLGAKVLINGRTRERVDAAMTALRAEVADADLVAAPADCSTAAGIEALLASAPSLDILVNNVGIFEVKAFDAVSDADWMRFFETNVMSGIRLSRALAPSMRERGWGRIIFISSESALQIPTEMIHYGMTKTAQLAISRGVAQTLSGSGVTCNAVLAGPTKSEGLGTFVKQMAADNGVDEATMEEQFFKTARPSSLIRRFLSTGEVANLAAFLCTPAASGITGAALRVDGGVVSAIP